MRSACVICSWSLNGTAHQSPSSSASAHEAAMMKVLDKPHLDITAPIGRGFIAVISTLAEDERQRIIKRADDGRSAACMRGVHMGRKRRIELQVCGRLETKVRVLAQTGLSFDLNSQYTCSDKFTQKLPSAPKSAAATR